jgi:hypothetical protein
MRYHLLFLFALIITACGPKPDPEAQIRQIVAATLAAIPKVTAGPPPTPIPPIPTVTPFDLAGLFCEYQFCIGHPIDMAFFDVSAQKNVGAPSTYTQGIIASYNANLFLEIIWQTAPGTSDPRFLLDLILDDGLDTTIGTPEVKLIRDMNVYTPITTTATTVLPFGGAAAWTCGDRVFAWKAYTPDEASPAGLFDTALSRFVCKK